MSETKLHSSHLSGEQVALLHSRELPEAEISSLQQHVRFCEECRQRLEEYAEWLETVRDIGLEEDLAQVLARVDGPAARQKRRWRLSASGAIAATVILTFAVYSLRPAPLTAGEFLRRADAETKTGSPSGARRIAVRFGNISCGPDLMQAGTGCSPLLAALGTVHWDPAHLLSARSFEQWHDALPEKADEVSKLGGRLRLKTETSRSPLRRARLDVNATDFHAVAALLEFENLAPLEVEEVPGTAAPLVASVKPNPAPALPTPVPATPEAPAVADMAVEVDSRLHAMGADHGFETVVLLRDREIEVFGVVPEAAREQQLWEHLHGLPGVRLHLKTYADASVEDLSIFPRLNAQPMGAPLAQKWLKQYFPDNAAQNTFVTQTIGLARDIAGLASQRAILSKQKASLSMAASARLAQLIQEIGREQSAAQRLLSARLSELAMIDSERSSPMDLVSAQSLHANLTYLLLGGDQSSADADGCIAAIRAALSAQNNSRVETEDSHKTTR